MALESIWPPIIWCIIGIIPVIPGPVMGGWAGGCPGWDGPFG